MKLAMLTAGLACEVEQGSLEQEVHALVYFSAQVTGGALFFAIPGAQEDGAQYIDDAAARGAVAVVTERAYSGAADLTVIRVENVRRAMAHMSAVFYGWPCRELTTIGVTGTKGKTTTTMMIQQILLAAGIKTGLIGTVSNGWPGHEEAASRTTPEAPEIQRLCREMADDGCQAVIMEVSSQGLMLSRVAEIDFDYALFTNLSPDHIGRGEHRDFAEYCDWKRTLFSQCRVAVGNTDDPHWPKMLGNSRAEKVITFGESKAANYHIRSVQPQFDEEESGEKKRLGILCRLTECGVRQDVQAPYQRPRWKRICRTMKLQIGMAGGLSAFNAAGAVAVARDMGVGWPEIRQALAQIRVRGRLEQVEAAGKEFTVLVDYAHNGVALRRLLTDLRLYRPERLITVFGCGGDRDRNRRFEMGEAAGELADFTVITSDNPRTEEPTRILDDIEGAVKKAGGNSICIPDRAEAISWALAQGAKGDIIVIAGKGHETTQTIGKEKRHFDDREMIWAIDRGTKHEETEDK